MRIFLFLLIISLPVLAQHAINAVPVSSRPAIDGYLDESVWQQAAVIDELWQREPNTGQPATEKTEILICYDEDNLYFGLRCLDSRPDLITAKELARDVSLRYDDKIQIILDTFLDRRTAYWFQLSPRGSKGDALISENGASFNKSWDGLWQGKAHITDWGWEGELAIPFKTLAFEPGQSTWGLKIIRQVTRKSETGYWPVANLDTYKFQVSDAGLLTGLENISQGIGLDVTPYAVGGVRDRKQNTNWRGDAGFDAFYQITSGLKSALTVNTDFAQTEVDDRQVNLTRFPLFFEEKRDFFLDGANYFNFGLAADDGNPFSRDLIPFFSRRLGLDQNGNPIPIHVGAKFTGKAGNWNIGFLDIVDERRGGSNAAVGRVSYQFGAQSSVGAIGTFGNATSAADNSLAGVDLRLGTSAFRGSQNISMLLFAMKSKTEGITDKDWSWGASLAYPNDFFEMRAGFHEIGDHFNAGIGFVPRHGIRTTYGQAAVKPRPQKLGILQLQSGVDIAHITDTNNQLLTQEIDFDALSITMIQGSTFEIEFSRQFEKLKRPFTIRNPYTIPVADYTFWRYGAEFSSARHRNFWVGVRYRGGDFYNGARYMWEVEGGYKIGVPLSVRWAFEHNDVELPVGAFSTDIARLNLDVLFSPSLTWLNFLQYDNLSKNIGWQSRFVWIVKPGREIFLVYQALADDPFERFIMREQKAQFKLKYAIRF